MYTQEPEWVKTQYRQSCKYASGVGLITTCRLLPDHCTSVDRMSTTPPLTRVVKVEPTLVLPALNTTLH
jgi:hypothetical protein